MRTPIIEKIKELAIDPRRAYHLQHVETLMMYRGLLGDREEVCSAMRAYTADDPYMAEHLIAAPFVVQFGSFVRGLEEYGRWPTFGEVGRCMGVALEGYVDPALLKKWGSDYMIRKHAVRQPKWFEQVASRSGTLQTHLRIQDREALVQQYVDHLKIVLDMDCIEEFADFILESTLNVQGDLRQAMVSELVRNYRSRV